MSVQRRRSRSTSSHRRQRDQDIGISTAVRQAALTKEATSYALVVGVDHFDKPDPDLPRLLNAQSDAASLSMALSALQFTMSLASFHATPNWNGRLRLSSSSATKPAILDALSALADEATEDDQILLYFSGHSRMRVAQATGVQEIAFCGFDYDYDDPATAVGLAELLGSLKTAKFAQCLIIFDFCRAGAALKDAPAILKGMRSTATENSIHFIASAMPDQSASDQGRSRNRSPFAEYLIDTLNAFRERPEGAWMTVDSLMLPLTYMTSELRDRYRFPRWQQPMLFPLLGVHPFVFCKHPRPRSFLTIDFEANRRRHISLLDNQGDKGNGSGSGSGSGTHVGTTSAETSGSSRNVHDERHGRHKGMGYQVNVGVALMAYDFAKDNVGAVIGRIKPDKTAWEPDVKSAIKHLGLAEQLLLIAKGRELVQVMSRIDHQQDELTDRLRDAQRKLETARAQAEQLPDSVLRKEQVEQAIGHVDVLKVKLAALRSVHDSLSLQREAMRNVGSVLDLIAQVHVVLRAPLFLQWRLDVVPKIMAIVKSNFVLAVMGQKNSGKSTFVEAFVGMSLSPNADVPMTLIPTVITHAPGSTTPVMRMRGFRTTLNALVESVRLAPATVEQHVSGRGRLEDVYFKAIDKASKLHFLAGYEGADAIRQALTDANNLVRLITDYNQHAWLYATRGGESGITDRDFFMFDSMGLETITHIDLLPEIQVQMAAFRDEALPVQYSLIDCPGLNEATHDDVMRSLVEVLVTNCTKVAMLVPVGDRPERGMMNLIRDVILERDRQAIIAASSGTASADTRSGDENDNDSVVIDSRGYPSRSGSGRRRQTSRSPSLRTLQAHRQASMTTETGVRQADSSIASRSAGKQPALLEQHDVANAVQSVLTKSVSQSLVLVFSKADQMSLSSKKDVEAELPHEFRYSHVTYLRSLDASIAQRVLAWYAEGGQLPRVRSKDQMSWVNDFWAMYLGSRWESKLQNGDESELSAQAVIAAAQQMLLESGFPKTHEEFGIGNVSQAIPRRVYILQQALISNLAQLQIYTKNRASVGGRTGSVLVKARKQLRSALHSVQDKLRLKDLHPEPFLRASLATLRKQTLSDLSKSTAFRSKIDDHFPFTDDDRAAVEAEIAEELEAYKLPVLSYFSSTVKRGLDALQAEQGQAALQRVAVAIDDLCSQMEQQPSVGEVMFSTGRVTALSQFKKKILENFAVGRLPAGVLHYSNVASIQYVSVQEETSRPWYLLGLMKKRRHQVIGRHVVVDTDAVRRDTLQRCGDLFDQIARRYVLYVAQNADAMTKAYFKAFIEAIDAKIYSLYGPPPDPKKVEELVANMQKKQRELVTLGHRLDSMI